MSANSNILRTKAKPSARPRTMVGLSGGVDSSVTAFLLATAGYPVEALFMKNWDEDDDDQCTAEQDYADAKSVSSQLGIPLHARNFSSEYWDRVFSECLSEFENGRTPNPDVLCNREIKFNVFLEHAHLLGAEKMATGHYARVSATDGKYKLLKARDEEKDQTYFLYMLNQQQLSHTMFPLGELTKTEVRRIAAQQNFVTHAKKDSTGICFIGERKFRDFLGRFLPAKPGHIITETGETIGTHDGVMYYTVGQRKGLQIGGRRGAKAEPWYVARKNVAENTLLVVQGDDHPLLFQAELNAGKITWIAGSAPDFPFYCKAKTRYRQTDQSCVVDSINDGTLRVSFDSPQRAITPGQSIVFYAGDECLGGGIIEA